MFALYSVVPYLLAEGDVDLTNAMSALSTIGVLPVIAIVAILGLATVIYKRFRR